MNPHTLVVGGTGMLANATIELAADTREITLVASSTRSLSRVADRLPKTLRAVHLLPLDWTNRADFLAAIRKHVASTSVPALTLCWVHDDALGAQIAQAVASPDEPTRFIQVLGSQAANPAASLDPPPKLPRLQFQRLILGFELVGSGSRWLTHEEICDGVLRAIAARDETFIVGSVEPWSRRP